MDLKSKIILISGPTASGKSKAALKIAKKLNGEIINADSMQVYKELNILTARPSKTDLNKIDHHLYGFRSVKKEFSSGDWLKLAKKNIKKIRDKNKIPVLVGGTGLYFKALTDGLVKIPKIPIPIRNKIRRMQNKLGQKKFYLKLLNNDPLVKNKIDPTDVQRSIRAYEVIKFTKKSVFSWYTKTKPSFKKDEFIKIYVDYPKEILINKISKRVDQMMKNTNVLGSRMMGGGFGGSVLNLIKGTINDSVLETLNIKYFKSFGKKITPIKIKIVDGVKEIK